MTNYPVIPSTSILHLPDDCLYFIFQNFDCCSDRDSFGLTCRRWLHIQNFTRRSLQFHCSLTCLRIVSHILPSTNILPSHLHQLLRRFQQLQSLSLSGCTELPDLSLSVLLHYGSKLQSLYLDCCFDITDHGLSIVAHGCPSLTTISLYRCNITDIGLEALSKSCVALKDVNISYSVLVSDRGIRALTQNCRHLRAINISHCRNISGVGFQGCSNNLVYLEADSCKLEPEGIQGIVSGGGLEYLNISNLLWSIRGHGLASMDSGYLSQLRVLNLRLCRTIGNEAIVAISVGCPLLQEWNLALCHEVRLAGWASIGSNCSKLERLHVNRCQNLCDQGLQSLREGCKRLQHLYLSRCRRLSLTAIEMFKCLRSDVKIMDDEIMCIAPASAFRS